MLLCIDVLPDTKKMELELYLILVAQRHYLLRPDSA